MDPRKIAAKPKTIKKTKEWNGDDLPPRWSVFSKTRKTPPGWVWKGATLEAVDEKDLMVLVQANPQRDNWKAWLIVPHSRSVILRLEQHGAAGEGLHTHSNCDDSGLTCGPESIDTAPHRLNSRRNKPWTTESFWAFACKAFGVARNDVQGLLL